jgi:hypothetical protein
VEQSKAQWWCSVCEVLEDRRVGVWCGEVEAGLPYIASGGKGRRPVRWGMVGGGVD